MWLKLWFHSLMFSRFRIRLTETSAVAAEQKLYQVKTLEKLQFIYVEFAIYWHQCNRHQCQFGFFESHFAIGHSNIYGSCDMITSLMQWRCNRNAANANQTPERRNVCTFASKWMRCKQNIRWINVTQSIEFLWNVIDMQNIQLYRIVSPENLSIRMKGQHSPWNSIEFKCLCDTRTVELSKCFVVRVTPRLTDWSVQ